jgi:hypothetical protein
MSYFVIANFPVINVKHIGEYLFHISSKSLFNTLQCHKNISKSVFRICDILVRIRVRILGVESGRPKNTDPEYWYIDIILQR